MASHIHSQMKRNSQSRSIGNMPRSHTYFIQSPMKRGSQSRSIGNMPRSPTYFIQSPMKRGSQSRSIGICSARSRLIGVQKYGIYLTIAPLSVIRINFCIYLRPVTAEHSA